MANPGKRFEERVRRSLEESGYVLRLLDNGAAKNKAMPADYVYSQDGKVFMVECKATRHGGAINAERLVQLPRLLKVEEETGGAIRGVFFLQFYTERDGRLATEDVYAITARDMRRVLTQQSRKSFSEPLAVMKADQISRCSGWYGFEGWFGRRF